MIFGFIQDKYITHIRHNSTAYQRVQPLILFEHIWKEYGIVDDANMSKNEAKIRKSWIPPTKIEMFYENLETGQRYGSKIWKLTPDGLITRLGYELVKKIGLFKLPYEIWRNKSKRDWTWDNFKIFFTRAENDRSQKAVKSFRYVNSMTATKIEDTIKSQVHQELTSLLYVEQAHTQNTQVNKSPSFTIT